MMAMPALIGFLPMAASFYVITVAAIAWSSLRGHHRIAHAALLGWSMLVCLGVSAPLLLPLLSTLGDSIELSAHGSMPVRMLLTLLAPGIYGQFGPPEQYRGVIDVTVDYLYMGVALLGVSASSLVVGPRVAQQLLGVGVACGLVTFAPDMAVRALQAAPVVGPLLRPFMFCFPMALFVILSAAHVMDRQGARLAPTICCLFASAIGLVCAVRWTAGDLVDSDLLLRLAVPLAIFSASAAMLPQQARPWAVVFLVIAEPTVVNFNRSAWAYPGSPNTHSPTMVDGKGEKLLGMMRAEARAPHRVAVDQEVFGGPWNGYWPVWGIECINGFDPQVHSVYLEEIKRRVATWHSDRLFNPGQVESALFETLNVKFLLARQRLESPSWRQVMEDGRYHLYEFTRFRPRYELMAKCGGESGKLGDVTVLERTMSGAVLKVNVSADHAVLVIRERAYPEWCVTVDGRRATTFTIDNLIMGLELPMGSHEVVLEYVSPELQVGLASAGLTLGACAAVTLASANSRRSRAAKC